MPTSRPATGHRPCRSSSGENAPRRPRAARPANNWKARGLQGMIQPGRQRARLETNQHDAPAKRLQPLGDHPRLRVARPSPNNPPLFIEHANLRRLEAHIQTGIQSHRCSPFLLDIDSRKVRLSAGEQQPHVWDVSEAVIDDLQWRGAGGHRRIRRRSQSLGSSAVANRSYEFPGSDLFHSRGHKMTQCSPCVLVVFGKPRAVVAPSCQVAVSNCGNSTSFSSRT